MQHKVSIPFHNAPSAFYRLSLTPQLQKKHLSSKKIHYKNHERGQNVHQMLLNDQNSLHCLQCCIHAKMLLEFYLSMQKATSQNNSTDLEIGADNHKPQFFTQLKNFSWGKFANFDPSPPLCVPLCGTQFTRSGAPVCWADPKVEEHFPKGDSPPPLKEQFGTEINILASEL